ncbi:MAG: hypothetical protein NTY15_02415 [Planctomycetota bacterium]|nr:hypothetical protein [Planctomycetota bacterium]
MNQIDAFEDTIDQVVCSPIESLQVDLGKFNKKLDSYCKETESYLGVNNDSPSETRSALRWLTVMLFGVVVAVTLLLNVGIVMAGATNSQMAICNIGIAVLYVLVGMCVMSDLARGKTHFQDERERLMERLKRVAEQVRELVRERQHWTTEAAQSKWATDNEKLKLQLAKQQVESIQEKLEASFAELQILVESVEQKEKAEAELEETLISRDATKAAMIVQTRDLEEQIAKSTATIEELNARIHEDNLTLLAKVSENEAKLAEMQESLSLLNLDMNEKTLAGDALTAKLSEDHRAIEFAIAEANLSRERIMAEVSQATAEYEALKENVATSQQTNVELINQTVELEAGLSQRQESIILADANLRSLDVSLLDKKTQLETIVSESVGVEQRIAQLLTQLAELEYLSAFKLATDASETLSLAANRQEMIEAEKEQRVELESMRGELDAIRSELDTRQILIEESFQNSHKISREAEKSLSDATRRVEMLSDKADSLAEQVEAKSTELFGHKQELISIRAEIRELEAAKVSVTRGVEELAEVELQLQSQRAELAELEEQIGESRRTLANKQEDIGLLDAQCRTHQAALETLNFELLDRSLNFDQLQTHYAQLANECQLMDASKIALNAQMEVTQNDLVEIQNRMHEQQTNYASLMAEHRSLSQEYERLVESTQQLREQNEEAELVTERLSQLKSYSEELEVQIASSNRQIDQLADEHDSLANAIKEQSATLELYSLRTQQIQSELPEWELKLATAQVRQSDLEQELCEMMNSLDGARLEKTEIESEERTAKTRIDKLNHRASEIEHECTSSVAKLQQLSDEVAEAQGIVQQWTDYMATLQSDRQKKEATIQTLEARISQLKSQELATSDAFESSKENLAATQLELQDIQAVKQRLELEWKTSQLELETTIQQRELENDHKAQIQFAIADLERQSLTMEQQLNTAMHQLEKTIEESTQRVQQRHALEQSIEELHAKRSSLESQLAMIQESSEALAATNREASDALAEARSEHAELKVQIANLETVAIECKTRQFDLQQLQQELSDHQAELGLIQQEVSTMEAKKNQLAKIEFAYEESQANLSKSTSEYGQLRSRMSLLETEFSQLDSAYTEKKFALEQLNDLAAEKQATLRTLEMDLQSNRDHSAQLQSQILLDSDRLATIDRSIVNKTTHADELEYHLDVLQRETRKLSARRKTLEDSIALLMESENKLQEKNRVVSQQQAESALAAQQRIDQLTETLQSLNVSRNAAESDLQSKELAIRDLENEMQNTKRAIQDAKQVWDETQSAVCDSLKKLDDTNASKLESENELNASRKASQLLVREQEQKKHEIQAIEALLATVKTTLQDLQTEKVKLVPEVKALKEKCDELEIDRKNTMDAINTLILQREELASLSQAMNAKLQENESSTMLLKNVTVLENKSLSYFDSVEDVAVEDDPKSLSISSEMSIEDDVLVAVNSLKNVVPPPRVIGVAKIDAWDLVFSGSTNE